MVDSSSDVNLTTLAVGDIGGDFFVPAYQRGYRWGNQEVTQLLNDIRESRGKTYYLQPIVVKLRDDGSWELIDGQQRLTTLYLIFRYLKLEHLPRARMTYTLTYETRDGSREYLEKLTEEDANKNIDYFHMFQAYRRIKSWFESFGHRDAHEASRFHDSLFEDVKVLWYEAPKETDSTELFTRLNVGRIPLTDAELVKARLLSRSDRAVEIAAQWDGFERDLRAPELWAFVTGETENRPTNISLLLDTLAGGPRGRERPLFHTFETLRDRIVEDPQRFWSDVVDLHSLVLGWFEDRDLFHKVGYLIALGVSFENLAKLSEGKGRGAFEASLDAEIRNRLNLSTEDVANLTYTSNKTSDVLLLMNVETIRRTADSSERYSFRAHAAGAWSLEHIHAQNAEALTRVEQWKEWLDCHREALADLPDIDDAQRADLLGRIDEVLSGDVTQQIFSDLEHEITAVFSPNDEQDGGDVHLITNLALLDSRDNSSLSNSVFEVKRRRMITRDKAGSYIPVCTRNVFLKYYTEVVGQAHFWSARDRSAYLAAIQEVVHPYLRRGGKKA